MSISPINEIPTNGGGLIRISSREELIRQRLEDERRRLEKEAGIEKRAPAGLAASGCMRPSTGWPCGIPVLRGSECCPSSRAEA